MCERLKAQLELQDIEVHSIPYKSGDFNSMDLAIMKIAGTNPMDRRDEFRRLYYNAKSALKSTGIGSILGQSFWKPNQSAMPFLFQTTLELSVTS